MPDTPNRPTTDDTTSTHDGGERPYNRIPRTGTHRGDAEGLESGLNVRAPKPSPPGERLADEDDGDEA